MIDEEIEDLILDDFFLATEAEEVSRKTETETK